MHCRHRRLQCLLRQYSYPPVVFVRDIGKLPDKSVFHSLDATYYTPVATGSCGVAILFRIVSQVREPEEHYFPDSRALILRLLYMEHCIQLCNVYLKSGAEPHEIRFTMAWAHPFVQILDLFQIFGGDFNVNRGWDFTCPLASSAVGASTLDSFENVSIRVVPTVNLGPTWISPKGYFGSLDHFLISQLDEQSVVVTIYTESVFPSDHFPTCLQLRNIQAMEAPVAIHTWGRILAPKIIPSQYIQKYQALFSDLLNRGAPDTLHAYYRHFSNMVVPAAISTFGEPFGETPLPHLP